MKMMYVTIAQFSDDFFLSFPHLQSFVSEVERAQLAIDTFIFDNKIPYSFSLV
jgi:hypothetical protein